MNERSSRREERKTKRRRTAARRGGPAAAVIRAEKARFPSRRSRRRSRAKNGRVSGITRRSRGGGLKAPLFPPRRLAVVFAHRRAELAQRIAVQDGESNRELGRWSALLAAEIKSCGGKKSVKVSSSEISKTWLALHGCLSQLACVCVCVCVCV